MRALILISLILAACSHTGGSVGEQAEATTVPTPSTTSTTKTQVPSTTTTEADPREWYLVSVTASLPEGLAAGLLTLEGVDSVSTASVGTLPLVETRGEAGTVVDQAPDGYVIPLEAQSFNPPGRSEFVPASVERMLDGLAAGEAILSESSATLRRLGVGSQLILDGGAVLNVIGIVEDEWVGHAEVVVSVDDADALGITNERYSVVRFDGSAADLDTAANALVAESVRVRSRGEVDAFRHADAVASQLAVKTKYGEFAYRPGSGDSIEIDPAWVDSNILHEHIPLLGGITCHKDFVEMLREVMTALEEAGHSAAIDRSAYKGCWNPRFIRGRADLSHHAWGAAADINFGNDLDGPGSPTSPELLAAMAELGILSGHTWTNPGPGHFEWFPQDG